MNCQNLREQQNTYHGSHPEGGVEDAHHGFCGDGAWIGGLLIFRPNF